MRGRGSVMSPSFFIIKASSFKPVHPFNKMSKFSDDTYFVTPLSNSNLLQAELDSLTEWANLRNISLNLERFPELIIHNNYNKITSTSHHPSLQRTASLTILRVSVTENLNFTLNIGNIIIKCY